MSFLTSFRNCQIMIYKKQLIKIIPKSHLKKYIVRGRKRRDFKKCLLPKISFYEKSLKII